MTKRLGLYAFLGSLLLSACAVSEPGQPDSTFDPGDDDRGAAAIDIPEGSDAARGVLRVANTSTEAQLESADAVNLYANTAQSIVGYRAGADGTPGNADDRTIGTVAELDAIQNVGPASLKRMLAYAHAQGWDLPAACEPSAPRPEAVRLVVSPDDGEAFILDLLGSAKKTIDIVIYQMGSKVVLDALTAAAQRGVAVRVILDSRQDQNPALVQRLGGLGMQAHLSSGAFTYTHQKTVVVDHAQALVYSGNLESSSLRRERNYGIVEHDAQDLGDLEALFEADWAARTADVSCTRLVVSPINSRDRILELVNAARTTLDVEAMYMTERTLVDAVLAAHRRGVAVRVLLNDPATGVGSDGTGPELKAAGIPARYATEMFIHAKVLVVDGERFFLGSENFSRTSLLSNREVGVILTTPEVDVARVRTIFENDFAHGTAF